MTGHDSLSKVIQCELCKKSKFEYKSNWYIHKPTSVLETYNNLLDFEIRMRYPILARRPDHIIINNQKKKRTCRIVEFAVPADNRLKLKESAKMGKYLNLARPLEKEPWNMKVSIIPIVTGAFGTVTKNW